MLLWRAGSQKGSHSEYAREGTGHALIAARQWIPREQLADPARRTITGLPPDLAFRTKGQLAIDLPGEVLADGVRLDFACGDEVYGSCTQLREYLEARGQAYVLRVPSNFYLTVARGVRLTCKDAAAQQPAGDRRWEVRSAGTGSKGQRWYAWARLGTASPQHYLLIRRHLVTGKLAFCYCFVPASQQASLTRLVRAAGCRWPAEEDFRSGKGCFGLDESQVRLYTSIARHTVLAMAALAICAVTAALLSHRTDTRAPPAGHPPGTDHRHHHQPAPARLERPRTRRPAARQTPEHAHPARRTDTPGLLHPHRLRNLQTQHADGEHPSLDNRARPLTSRLCYAMACGHPRLNPDESRRSWQLSGTGPLSLASRWVSGLTVIVAA